MPGLGRNDATVAHCFLRYVRPAVRFDFITNVLVTGHAQPLGDAGTNQHLNAMANGKHPFVGGAELTDQLLHMRIIAQVFWCVMSKIFLLMDKVPNK